MNPGPWVDHSLNVAYAARAIAEKHNDLDPIKAYHLGALHDIGRRVGVTGMRHVLDGYNFLMGIGLADAARICISHSYNFKDFRAGIGTFDGSEEEIQFVKDYLANAQYDDYDRLIQLCDAVATATGFVLLEKRCFNVVVRYCRNSDKPMKWTVRKWVSLLETKKKFEEEIGCSIYDLLPDVAFNTIKVELDTST